MRWTRVGICREASRAGCDRETNVSDATRRAVVRYGKPLRSCAWGRRVIRCVQGCAWVTVDGDVADNVLGPGQAVVVPARRLVLVTGMDCCILEIQPL